MHCFHQFSDALPNVVPDADFQFDAQIARMNSHVLHNPAKLIFRKTIFKGLNSALVTTKWHLILILLTCDQPSAPFIRFSPTCFFVPPEGPSLPSLFTIKIHKRRLKYATRKKYKTFGSHSELTRLQASIKSLISKSRNMYQASVDTALPCRTPHSQSHPSLSEASLLGHLNYCVKYLVML